MRLLFSITLFLIYVLGSVGTSFSLHLCHGQVTEVKISGSEIPHTGCCNQAETSDCCSEVQVILKTDKSQVASFLKIQLDDFVLGSTPYSYLDFSATPTSQENFSYNRYAQPPPGLWQGIPLFTLYSHRKLDC